MNQKSQRLAILAVLLMAAGCSAPTSKVDNVTTNVPRQPDLTLQVASLNLSAFNKLYNKKEIDKLAGLLKKEQIDILAVQGITRYPGIERHVDFVNELVSRSDMRQVFGEMFNTAGRQSGNGIFSTYPLRNNHNEPFDGVKSALFEAALESAVDGGVKDIVVVSALMPSKAPESDLSKCLKIISDKSLAGTDQPLILTGNLPSSPIMRQSGRYRDVLDSIGTKNDKILSTKIWYTKDESLSLLGTRALDTDFGTMLVARFGLFR